MNTMLSILGITAAVVPAVASFGAAVPALLVWSTVLVWLTVALLLASVVAILAAGARPRSSGARTQTSWPGRGTLQVCTACTR